MGIRKIAHTPTNKVIVARSYTRLVAAGSNPTNPAADSRPDDYSPRDREGHGTAIASVIAANPTKGVVTISGMAPKAWLGNYKVFGSPNVNDYPPESVFIQAVNDAVKDGMDVVNLSSGITATTGAVGYRRGMRPGRRRSLRPDGNGV